MSEISEHLERLINRSLDGDLDDDARLELNRELIRNPAARAMLSEYQAIDRGASTALSRAFGDTAVTPSLPVEARSTQALRYSHRRHIVRWLIPGAIAAALLATVIPYPSLVAPNRPGDSFVALPNGHAPTLTQPSEVPIRTVSTASGVPTVHRDRGRDIIGVMGDDGNLYWIEVEKTRTVTLPHGDPSKPANVF